MKQFRPLVAANDFQKSGKSLAGTCAPTDPERPWLEEALSRKETHEAGRRLLPAWTQAHAEVVARNGFIVVNRSSMEFLTSDRPVSHVFLHIDEHPVASFPETRRASVKPNARAHFSFTPLTPKLAFVSSALLNGPRPYGDLTDAVMEVQRSNIARIQANGLLLYTSENRYWISSTDVVHGSGSHPLIGRLSFTTPMVQLFSKSRRMAGFERSRCIPLGMR